MLPIQSAVSCFFLTFPLFISHCLISSVQNEKIIPGQYLSSRHTHPAHVSSTPWYKAANDKYSGIIVSPSVRPAPLRLTYLMTRLVQRKSRNKSILRNRVPFASNTGLEKSLVVC